MKGLFIPEITTEMFRNGCLESIESLMAEGEIYDIDYPLEQEPCDDATRRMYEIATEALEEPKAENKKRLTNAEWKDFLSEQFGISRTSAAEMLHGMMRWKGEDNFKKQFSGRK